MSKRPIDPDLYIPPGALRVDSDPLRKTPGRCWRCGCTDDRACAGGCSWADATRTVCTRCVPAQGPAVVHVVNLPPPQGRPLCGLDGLRGGRWVLLAEAAQHQPPPGACEACWFAAQDTAAPRRRARARAGARLKQQAPYEYRRFTVAELEAGGGPAELLEPLEALTRVVGGILGLSDPVRIEGAAIRRGRQGVKAAIAVRKDTKRRRRGRIGPKG